MKAKGGEALIFRYYPDKTVWIVTESFTCQVANKYTVL